MKADVKIKDVTDVVEQLGYDELQRRIDGGEKLDPYAEPECNESDEPPEDLDDEDKPDSDEDDLAVPDSDEPEPESKVVKVLNPTLRYERPALKPALKDDPDPHPVPDEARIGWIGDMVRYVSGRTEINQAPILFMTLAAVGNAVGPRPYIYVKATKHRCNLSVVTVAETSDGKGTAADIITNIVSMADEAWGVDSGLNSGEGVGALIKDYCAAHNLIPGDLKDDEAPRLYMDEQEFKRICAAASRSNSTLSPILRRLWEGVRFQNIVSDKDRRMNGKAYITVSGNITPEELRETITDMDFVNGFGNRFLWIKLENIRDEEDDSTFVNDPGFISLGKSLNAILAKAKQVGRMELDRDAKEEWDFWIGHTLKHRKHITDRRIRKITARARPYVLRMAMIYQLTLGGSKITRQALMAALRAWEINERCCEALFGSQAVTMTPEDKIVAYCDKPQSRTNIMKKLFNGHIKVKDLDPMLEKLCGAGRLIMFKGDAPETGGEGSEMYKAVWWK